jgi:hypothetical protein
MKKSCAVPDMVRLVPQSGFHPDCAVSAVAMLCGVMYQDALASFADPRDVMLNGVSWPMVQAAAKRLGFRTRLRLRRYDLTEDTGILNVIRPKDEHLTFLWEGRIVDGNGELWLSAADYLTHYSYTPKGLLVVAE